MINMLVPIFYSGIAYGGKAERCASSDLKEVPVSVSEPVNVSKCLLPMREAITRLYQRA